MDDQALYMQVAETFANYGMRKTSMEDLSRVMGVSRQTLYNRFKTKEAIRVWAVTGLTDDAISKAVGVFENSRKRPENAIVEALDRWAGDFFPLWKHTPHGFEVLNFDDGELEQQRNSVAATFERQLFQYLLDSETAKSRASAREVTFGVMLSVKGAFEMCSTSEEFTQAMSRVVKLLVKAASV